MIKSTTSRIGDLLYTIKVGNELGENVQWDVVSQSIWWTDIESCQIFSFSIENQNLTTYKMPYRVGSFALLENKNQQPLSEILVAFEQGIALYHLESKAIRWLFEPEKHIPGNRFNDGGVDRFGRFWVGTMVESAQQPSQPASLYCVELHQCKPMLSELTISNGLCFNESNTVMYHADSPTRTIFQYHLNNETLTLDNKTLFAKTPEGIFPDGSTVDANQCVWNAQWGGSQVVCYDPEGNIIHQLSLPVSQPTCVCIGGPNLDLLFITSAKNGLSHQQCQQQSEAGNLFIYQLHGIKGIAQKRCVFELN